MHGCFPEMFARDSSVNFSANSKKQGLRIQTSLWDQHDLASGRSPNSNLLQEMKLAVDPALLAFCEVANTRPKVLWLYG